VTEPLLPNDHAYREDRVAQTVLTLAKELWLLRDRQLVLEAVLEERGIAVQQLVDTYQPTGAVKERLARERRRFLDEIANALVPPPDAQ
jgi:hypothetical protein